jgi:hypothetical protein
MAHSFVARLSALVALASNAWTRHAISTALDPAAARRLAGLRYWDGDCVA